MAGLWLKLDCDYWDHPKIVQAGVMAGVLYLRMSAYCMQHTTDGFVPDAQVPRFALPSTGKLVAALAAAELIERADGGWLLPGYVERYPSAAELERRRQVNAENGRKGGRPRTQQKPKSVSGGLEIGTETEPNGNQDVDVDVDVETQSSSHGPAARPPAPDDDDLTTELLRTVGLAWPRPTDGEVATVARLLSRGWTPDQLRGMALRASQADVDPRAYLAKLLGEAVNARPTAASPPTERRGLLDDQRQPCATCDGSGMVGGIGDDGRPEPVSPCPACHVLGATA